MAKAKKQYKEATLYNAVVHTYDSTGEFVDEWTINNIVAKNATEAVAVANSYVMENYTADSCDVNSLNEVEYKIPVAQDV